MDRLWMILPGAVMAGLGAVVCGMGYRQVRSPGMSLGVCVFAAAGAATGAWMGYPSFAAGLCVAGAILGYAFHGVLFKACVGLAAAMGGAAVGLLWSVICDYSNPLLLCGATAAGGAGIALLDTRFMTIGWTSAAGAALVAHGLLRSTSVLSSLPRTQLAWTLAVIFVVLFAAGFAFQSRSTAEQHVSTQIAAVPSA